MLHEDLAPLIGSWRLVSATVSFTDTGERSEHFGEKPEGYMVLEPSGRIMFLLTRSARRPAESEAEQAALLQAMSAYSGRVRSGGKGEFITTVDASWNPAWSGEQRRFFEIDGDRLSIRTPEQTSPRLPGRAGVAELIFERETRG